MTLRSLAVVGCTILISTAASGAEKGIPDEPVMDIAAMGYDWSGGYVGVQVGAERIDIGGTTLDSNHVAAGIYAGFNLQENGLVAGIEGDVSYTGYDVTVSGTSGGQPVSLRLQKNVDGSVRGRMGYTFDNFLLYGTAGISVGRLDATGSLGATSGNQSQTLIGYTVGAGVEAGLTSNLVGRVEYRYTDYGAVAVDTGPVVSNFDMAAHRITAGMSYSF